MPLLLLGAAACGGDDDDSSSPTSAPDELEATAANNPTAVTVESDEDDDESQPPSGSGDGVIEINGESTDVNQVRRCEPFSDAEGNLDLQAIGQGVMLFIVVNQSTVLNQTLSLQGANAGGVFSVSASQTTAGGMWFDDDGAPIGFEPFTVSGDRISGSATLTDVQGGADTSDVSFDVAIPSEIIDCSL